MSKSRPTIELPTNWSQVDIERFLKLIKTEPKSSKTKTASDVKQRSEKKCYGTYPCAFWVQDGKLDYQGHCGLQSADCLTAVFRGESPPRWLAISEVRKF